MNRTLTTHQQVSCYAEGAGTLGIRSLSKRRRRFADFVTDESGQAIVPLCLCVTVVIGLLGLMTDLGSIRLPRKEVHTEGFDQSMRERVRQLCGRRDDGSSLIETALVLPLLILMLVGCVDYGRGFYAAIEVSAAAESGALYGTLNPSDTSGMVSMAKLDAADVSNINATATYGCECADGTGSSSNCTSSPLCSMNVVQYVEVTATAAYSPTLPYPGIPSTINLQNTVRLRASY
jgi:Flp pilus assembly protein TadG